VNLEQKTCSCRAWQVTGKPYTHALGFIARLSRKVHMDEFVHDYSVDRFKTGCDLVVPPSVLDMSMMRM
jgi:hypothetical protein